LPRFPGHDGLLRGHLFLGMGGHRPGDRCYPGGALRFAASGLGGRGGRHGHQRRIGGVRRRGRPAVDPGARFAEDGALRGGGCAAPPRVALGGRDLIQPKNRSRPVASGNRRRLCAGPAPHSVTDPPNATDHSLVFPIICRAQKKGLALQICGSDGVATGVPLSPLMRLLYKSWLQGSLGLLMLAAPALGANPASIRELDRIGVETERVSAAVGPKVVQIVTQSLKVAETGDEQPAGVLVAERGRGSGFFVAPDGYLITNAHVVANATRIRVLVPTPGATPADSPREYTAAVAGIDADNDLALLKVDVQPVPFF